MPLSPAGQLIFHRAESMDKVGYSKGRLSQQQYFHQACRQPSTTGRQCRKTRSDATMAWGPRPFSPPARHNHWGFQSNGTSTAHTIFMHLSNRDIPVFSDICGLVVNIDDEDLNGSRQDANTLCKEAGMYHYTSTFAILPLVSASSAGTGCSKTQYFATAVNTSPTLSVRPYASLIRL
jgi:hypothetical protein